MVLITRPLQPEDIEAVVGLEAASFPQPWSESLLRGEVDGPGRSYLVLVEADEVLGYGGIMIIGTDAHVMTIAVDPGHRRRGLGSHLMLDLIDTALAAGAEHLTLELRVSNTAARRLYEKFGFTPVGVRPGYYSDEDALVMWALDAAGDDYRAELDRIRGEAA
jgi:ribosomal-protein-alanine N-acetyltransferase